MDAAVGMANSKVLFNPMQSPAVIKATNQVTAEVLEFHDLLGIDSGRESSEARAWGDAASEHLDKVRGTGAAGVASVKNFGGERLGQARSAKGRLAGRVAERLSRIADNEAGDDSG